MKKFLSILLIFILCLSFSAVFAQSMESVKVIEKQLIDQTEKLNTNLKIPQIEGMENKVLQTKLNAEFMRTIIQFKNEVQKQTNEGERFPYEAVATYFVSYNENNVLSLTIELYSYTGGAHGMTIRKSYNINLKNGKNLQLNDLFKKDYNYQDVINKEIKKQIDAAPEGYYFKDEFKTIKADQPYYLKNQGIVIYFDLYEIAPYVTGFPEFLIPYELVKDGLIK